MPEKLRASSLGNASIVELAPEHTACSGRPPVLLVREPPGMMRNSLQDVPECTTLGF